MISIGIDIAKEKFTVCALEQGSKIIWKPFDIHLKKTKVEEFLKKLDALNEEVKIVMEATGKYHFNFHNIISFYVLYDIYPLRKI